VRTERQCDPDSKSVGNAVLRLDCKRFRVICTLDCTAKTKQKNANTKHKCEKLFSE